MTGHIEEYLRRVHVTPPRALTGKIVIAEYDLGGS
ncbi:hypothetical protein FB566_4673 [Stackebrandtia endophytica]|uniref:Uncharacterized protein n=1 Tax=Stackebrandtia endophytica TaxID=1496996 RepID=A0A543B2N2_9ACTN|nr:hypothetical protein FB566_4673 [Stackebrandtia endophytica]